MTAVAQLQSTLEGSAFRVPAWATPFDPDSSLQKPRRRHEEGGPADLDRATLRDCVEGRRAAWRLLHDRYFPVAMAFLRRMGVTHEELEDACQEVFIRCHRALPSFRGESQFKTWFYRLCLTEATRSYRRQRVARATRHIMLTLSSSPPVTQLEMSPHATAQRVEEALDEMNDGDRRVFVLYELQGLSGRQVADLLGCPVATVWRRLHYARRIFRQIVNRAGLV